MRVFLSGVQALLRRLDRSVPRIRILGLHWVIPVALLLHVAAWLFSTRVPIVAHRLPDLDAWSAPFLVLGMIVAALWVHTQWRDRPMLPLGLRPGVAWTPAVGLLIALALVIPPLTVSWTAAARIRALARQEPLKTVLEEHDRLKGSDFTHHMFWPKNAFRPTGLCSLLTVEAGALGTAPGQSAEWHRRAFVTRSLLDILSGSQEVSRGLTAACSHRDRAALESFYWSRRGKPIETNYAILQNVRGDQLKSYLHDGPGALLYGKMSRLGFHYGDPYWIAVLVVSCTALANAAALGGLLSRASLVRWASSVLAGVFVLLVLLGKVDVSILQTGALAVLLLACIAVAIALARRRRSSVADLCLVALFVGAPCGLLLVALRGSYLGRIQDSFPFIAVTWSLLLSLWTWLWGSRYRALAVEDGLFAWIELQSALLGRISFHLSRHSPALTLLMPAVILPLLMALYALAILVADSSIDPSDVPDPYLTATIFTSLGVMVCTVWLASQWRLRAKAPAGTGAGWAVGPAPALPLIVMCLAAGQFAGDRQTRNIAAVEAREEVRSAVDRMSFVFREWGSSEPHPEGPLPRQYQWGDAIECDGLEPPTKEVLAANALLGGHDEADVEPIVRRCQELGKGGRVRTEKGFRLRDNLWRLLDARAESDPAAMPWRGALSRETRAPLPIVLFSTAFLALFAIAGVVRPGDGAATLVAVVVAGAVADALRRGPGLKDTFLLISVGLLLAAACAGLAAGIRRKRRTRWTDRCLVAVALCVPFGIEIYASRITSPYHLAVVFAVAGAWSLVVTVAHRAFATWYRDLPFEEG
jgi:hypothetical protein